MACAVTRQPALRQGWKIFFRVSTIKVILVLVRELHAKWGRAVAVTGLRVVFVRSGYKMATNISIRYGTMLIWKMD